MLAEATKHVIKPRSGSKGLDWNDVSTQLVRDRVLPAQELPN
jgi:hypothetical protein